MTEYVPAPAPVSSAPKVANLCEELGDLFRTRVRSLREQASTVPIVNQLMQSAEVVAGDFEDQGYSSQFAIFNTELIRPFKRSGEGRVCSDFLNTLSLMPRNPKMAFIIWNVICFWVGIADVILVLLLEHGLSTFTALLGAVDGALGYIFACESSPSLFLFKIEPRTHPCLPLRTARTPPPCACRHLLFSLHFDRHAH